MNKLLKRGLGTLLCLSILCPVNAFAFTKTESVFTNLNTDGSLEKTIVTNHICPINKEEYLDNSELEEIVNLNGSETFTHEGSTLKWKSDGKDIYYQGTTKKESPIKININYYLDGEKKQAKDIVGKKGNIKIEINMENTLKNEVNVNGKIEEIYTPFVVMGGTIIETKHNSNISVTNGKVVETGSKAIVASIASPGVYESLNIDKLSNLNKIEISYDTDKFTLNNIYILATPKLLEEKDIKAFKEVDSLVDSINLLQTNMDKIESGSKELSDGLKTAYDGSSLIKEKVSESISSLEDNEENVLDKETLENLKNQAILGATLGEEELDQIGSLAASKAGLTEEQLQMIADSALNEVGTITLSDEQKSQIISSVDNAVDYYYGDTIKAGARDNVDSLVSGVSSNISITKEDIIALSGNQVDENVAEIISTNLNNALTSKLEGAKSIMYASAENRALASAKQIAENSALLAAENVANTVASDLVPAVAMGVSSKVAPLVASEVAKQTASETAKTVAGKVAPVVGENVAKEVKKEASKKIKDSMTILNNGLTELNIGIEKLYNGSNELSTGINTFNNQGIRVLSSYTGTIKTYTSKLEALVNLSKEYKGFTTNNSDETLFISKVKSLKAD